jgi:hypothetical protein
MDSSGECIALSVFNIAVDKGLLLGDTVAIPEPFLQNNQASFDDEVGLFVNLIFSLLLANIIFLPWASKSQ